MKRFLVFAGYCYYPEGGWSDFEGSFETKEKAINYSVKTLRGKKNFRWTQVVDTESETVVEEG